MIRYITLPSHWANCGWWGKEVYGVINQIITCEEMSLWQR